MLLDYAGIIPGAAAALMGLITLTAKDMARWKKACLVVLTLIAIGGTGVSQWWTLHERAQEQTEREGIRNHLGELEGEGERLIKQCLDNSAPLPEAAAHEWTDQVESFLSQKLGPSYVTRFRSDAGVTAHGIPSGGVLNDRLGLWWWLYARVARLDQFASELAGRRGRGTDRTRPTAVAVSLGGGCGDGDGDRLGRPTDASRVALAAVHSLRMQGNLGGSLNGLGGAGQKCDHFQCIRKAPVAGWGQADLETSCQGNYLELGFDKPVCATFISCRVRSGGKLGCASYRQSGRIRGDHVGVAPAKHASEAGRLHTAGN
jgi:hypothetical protein